MYQESTFKIGRVVAFTGGTVLLGGFLYLFFSFMGSVIVFDSIGQVSEAVATNGHREQRLYRLPGRTFWGLTQFEGEVEVRCRDGVRSRGGYVGGPGQLRLEVHEGCELIEVH